MSPEKARQKKSESESAARKQDKERETRSSSRSAKTESKTESKSSQRSASAGKSNKSNRSKESASHLPAGKSARTTDHHVIRRWVEERGGSPATVKATEKGDDPGLLRINFPGYSGENRLEDISWDEFFKKFDEKNLAFLYQDETRGGETSRFWKFVSREGEHEKGKK